MQAKANLIEPLLLKAEKYSKTSLELFKLKSLNKTADVSSTLFSRLLLIIVLSIFALTLNIAIALWLGDLLGKNYFGFLLVASFYGIIGIILFYMHPLIKTQVNNSIITQMLK
ncbi:MAG: hypothetical protein H0V01_10490 [Bacteroidetes bacterium]|nr:hypothetical protein [Bacteroidota bacterium]HET6245086.1 hypothetical protein [Bacteroidia bacterium]